MLHWRFKLSTVILVALAIAAAIGKGHGIGFSW
jgi:hypothetical protein